MQKEKKQLDNALDALIQRVQDMKNSIAAFLAKLENEYQHMNWPSILDNFALLSGQLNSLGRLLKNDKIPPLRSHILLPLCLSPDRDPELEKLTEGRVFAFNHEVVPDYLRTKPEPDVEDRIQSLTGKSPGLTPELAQKQLNNLNKITSNILDIINNQREDWESDANKSTLSQTSSITDTHTLLAASLYGKGLKTARRQDSNPQSAMPGQQPQQQQMQQKPQGGIGKVPSTIKTNIKQGATPHPYQRP